MKKLMAVVVMVVVAFAFTVWAGDTTKKEVKVTDKGGTEKVEVKEKAAGTKTKTEMEVKGKTVQGEVETKTAKGAVKEETVKFEKWENQGDYIYVVKDSKVVRLKHTLTENVKKDMLLKKGDTVVVTSTYPLSAGDVAVITGIQKSDAAKTVNAINDAGKELQKNEQKKSK
ncbi:MAG: hypothetical protein V2A66_05760 [Pseudomonadota bacterium]